MHALYLSTKAVLDAGNTHTTSPSDCIVSLENAFALQPSPAPVKYRGMHALFINDGLTPGTHHVSFRRVHIVSLSNEVQHYFR